SLCYPSFVLCTLLCGHLLYSSFFFFSFSPPPPSPPSFPTRRSSDLQSFISGVFTEGSRSGHMQKFAKMVKENPGLEPNFCMCPRSEEHTSELQSRFDIVCRLLLEKKKKQKVYSK